MRSKEKDPPDCRSPGDHLAASLRSRRGLRGGVCGGLCFCFCLCRPRLVFVRESGARVYRVLGLGNRVGRAVVIRYSENVGLYADKAVVELPERPGGRLAEKAVVRRSRGLSL